ncbi:MAG: hypothetical protein ACK4VY_07895 [Brevundimonas sp.]
MLVSTVIFALLTAVPAVQDPQVNPICEANASLCRVVPPFNIRAGGTSYPITPSGLRPWVEEDRLTIFPGESVVLVVAANGSLEVESVARAEGILKDEVITRLTAVFAPGGPGENATESDVIPGKEAVDIVAVPANRLRVTFRQEAEGEEMLLVIQNGFDDPVLYNAGMLVPDQGQTWTATSVCTIVEKRMAFEHWPHPILALSLGDFHIEKTPTPDSYRCA